MQFKIRKSQLTRWLIALILVGIASISHASAASAQVAPVNPSQPILNPALTTPTAGQSNTEIGPQGPSGPAGPSASNSGGGTASLNLNLGDALNKPSQSLLIIVLITVLSVAPALLIMLTSFTRIIIVLTLTRNALGVTTIPPNQVLAGMALFLSLFIMTPTLTEMNNQAIQPYINGQMNFNQAYTAASKPLKSFMLKHTRQAELALFSRAASDQKPSTPESVGMNALIPAFILSEIKTAFIIGFVIFIPFLVIDIIVSSSLMSMGMMMLPPQMISLPFKLLLFVLVDGWALIIKSLLTSFS